MQLRSGLTLATTQQAQPAQARRVRPTRQALRLAKVVQADMSEVIQIRYDAFTGVNNPLHDLEFPGCRTKKGRRNAARRMFKYLNQSKTIRMMKVVEPDTGEIFSYPSSYMASVFMLTLLR
jgi:hypothetical protein